MNDCEKRLILEITNKNVKIYTIIIAILPIVSIYASVIPGVNLGELILIVFLVYSLIFSTKCAHNFTPAFSLMLFGLYILTSTILAMFVDSSQISDVFIRTLRFMFYIFVVIYLSYRYFSIEYASKLVKNISVLAVVFIVIQKIFYTKFGILIKGFVPFVSLYTSQYETYNYEAMYNMFFYRPTSFFLEPSHFSQYVLIGLVICLFNKKSNLKSTLLGFFLTIGIILSTSGQGLVVAFIIWIMFILSLIFRKKRSHSNMILGILLMVSIFIALPFIINNEVVQSTMSRIFATGSNTAVSARTQGYIAFVSNESLFIKILGAGFGNTQESIWFSGIAYILYCTGLLGFLLIITIFCKHLYNSKDIYTKMVIFVCFVLSISADIINSYWIVFMFSFIYYPSSLKYHCIDEDNKKIKDTSSSVQIY